MGLAVFGIAAALIVVGIWWWRRDALRPRPRTVPPTRRNRGPEPDLDPDDAADLDRRFALVADATTARDDVVAVRLDDVRRRVVPVRVVEPVPDLGVSRVRFADGTTVLGHGELAGDMGLLVAAVHGHAVHVANCRRAPDGLHVRFAWDGVPSGVGVVVTGLDQPE